MLSAGWKPFKLFRHKAWIRNCIFKPSLQMYEYTWYVGSGKRGDSACPAPPLAGWRKTRSFVSWSLLNPKWSRTCPVAERGAVGVPAAARGWSTARSSVSGLPLPPCASRRCHVPRCAACGVAATPPWNAAACLLSHLCVGKKKQINLAYISLVARWGSAPARAQPCCFHLFSSVACVEGQSWGVVRLLCPAPLLCSVQVFCSV